MQENKYDDEIFFKKYSEMDRSKNGLKGAGEWFELQKLLPDFNNKKVLDLGCGYGWHCKYAADHGADNILGIDISKKMLDVASSINSSSNIIYKRAAIEDLEFNEASFDIIISSLTFHYIEDISILFKKISKWLIKEGHFIFSVEHPVFTSEGSQDWYYDTQGNILHFPVDNYYYEGKREALFLDEKVIKYHRTLTTYLQTLLHNNFIIEDIVEPKPQDKLLEIPNMKDELRRPMMLLIKVKKQ